MPALPRCAGLHALGGQVRNVRDATASYSDEMMHAALDINLPNYATIVTTKEIIAFSQLGRGARARGIDGDARGFGDNHSYR